jgi:biotin carboxyl carrier protein
MKKFKFKINENPYEVEIISVDDTTAEVSVNGSSYKVDVEPSSMQTKTPKLVRSMAVPSTDSSPTIMKTSPPVGGGTIKSPLPGAILAIHVKVGDKITVGQKLLTLEAMKMENNINSDKEGKVSAIKVKKGDTVMEGDALIVIE